MGKWKNVYKQAVNWSVSSICDYCYQCPKQPNKMTSVCLGPSCGSAYLHTRLSNLLQSWLCWFSSHFSRTKFYSSLCRQAYCLSKDHIYPFTRSTNWRSPLCNEQKKKLFQYGECIQNKVLRKVREALLNVRIISAVARPEKTLKQFYVKRKKKIIPNPSKLSVF